MATKLFAKMTKKILCLDLGHVKNSQVPSEDIRSARPSSGTPASTWLVLTEDKKGGGSGISGGSGSGGSSGGGSGGSSGGGSGGSSGKKMHLLEDAEAVRALGFIRDVVHIHDVLVDLPSLAPCRTVNECLTQLVGMCTQTMPSSTVKMILESATLQAIIPSLRSICGHAECELEAYWAAKVTKSLPSTDETGDATLAALTQFPYYDNYIQLTRLELCAMCAVEPRPPRRIAFIGSGPLPLTSLTLLRALRRHGQNRADADATFNVFGGGGMAHYNDDCVSVLNVDINPEAISAAMRLSLGLGKHAKGMEFICADGGEWDQDLAEFDVVYLAALVGATAEEKSAKLGQLAARMRPGALMVVRSCQDLKLCLYADLDLQTEFLLKRLEIATIMHPYGQVVNSVIVARVKQGAKQV